MSRVLVTIEYEFLGYYTSDGSVIEDLERSVKREFDIVNTGVRGFKTEAVAVSDLQNLLDFVEDYLKENRPEGRSD